MVGVSFHPSCSSLLEIHLLVPPVLYFNVLCLFPIHCQFINVVDFWLYVVHTEEVLASFLGWKASPVIKNHIASHTELVVEMIEHVHGRLVHISIQTHDSKSLDPRG